MYGYFLQNFSMFIKVFHFIVFLNKMYRSVICSEDGLMKIAENVQRLKQIFAVAAV